MQIDPARLAIIRDVLNELGAEVQTDEEVVAGLEIMVALTQEKRLMESRWRGCVPDEDEDE